MQSKKIPHGYQKAHTKDRMAKYDPENAQAWAVIMNKIRQEYAAGSTQLSIAKKLGVTKVAVSRWLSEDRGGERTTFGDMLRYAKALGIPFPDLVGESQNELELTAFDKTLALVLKQCANDADLTPDRLAQQSGLPTEKVIEILSGKIPTISSDLYAISNALEVGASILFKKTSKLIEK